jgi:hypothetical protein
MQRRDVEAAARKRVLPYFARRIAYGQSAVETAATPKSGFPNGFYHMVSALIGTVWAQNPESHPKKSRLKIVNMSKSPVRL